jgi:uncharacterized membrane protein YfcA
MDIIFVLVCAGLAGFVDAVVGGGGLILVPAMFSAYPNAPSATLLGNNKSVSLWGTLFAAWNFSRRISLPWARLAPAVACSLLSAFAGAWCLGLLPSTWLRLALPFILLTLLIYTWVSKRLGQAHAPLFKGRQETLMLMGVAWAIGFYDGFFGPGTGSFLIFILVRYLGYDFLHASYTAKVLNSASNAAALCLFIAQGQIWWHLAIPMAVCNVAGSFAGTTLAVRLGSNFVRWMFLLVVSALIVKTAWDAYGGWLRALLLT